VFLDDQLGWSFEAIGAFLAAWVIGYGVIQSFAPRFVQSEEVTAAARWVFALAVTTAAIALGVSFDATRTAAVVGGLFLFGAVFAVNSSLHSYLILAYSTGDDVSLDVGFYYSANAAGRLVGTLLSGVLYLLGGLIVALWGSAGFLAIAYVVTRSLPPSAQSKSISTSLEM